MINISESNHKTFLKRREVQVLLMDDILHQLIGSFVPWFTRFCTSQVVQDFFHQLHLLEMKWQNFGNSSKICPKRAMFLPQPDNFWIQFLSREQVWKWNIHHFLILSQCFSFPLTAQGVLHPDMLVENYPGESSTCSTDHRWTIMWPNTGHPRSSQDDNKDSPAIFVTQIVGFWLRQPQSWKWTKKSEVA